ncbi:hypothetical protein MKEN_01332500 [Mycena kentingensis (nom. inval.)]|nr:hypothetical protein MKEN_01332500 [Mycena kentingensis (nom. inval.)]
MPNPVDDAPKRPGVIALPEDGAAAPQPQSGSRIRSFHRRVAYFSLVALVAISLVLWQHPPSISKGEDELFVDAPPSKAHDGRLEPYQTPDSAVYCAEWVPGEAEGDVSVSFELDSSAQLAFVMARGPLSGDVDIFEDESASSDAPFSVSISGHFPTEEKLAETKACFIGAASENGVLLWAPPRHPHGNPAHEVRLKISVAVPRRGGSGGPGYNDFSTDLPLFEHKVGQFFHFITGTTFEAMRLKSANAAIEFEELVGGALYVETSNAKVRGFFAGHDLDVRTSNADIVSTAFMFGEAEGTESLVHIRTSNAPIQAQLSLISDYANNDLRATVATTNAALKMESRLDMAPNSAFHLSAHTSNAPAELFIDPSFEGTYDLRTSLASNEILQEENEDKRRERVVTKESRGKRASGEIYWKNLEDGERDGARRLGSLDVRTSLKPVVLHVV